MKYETVYRFGQSVWPILFNRRNIPKTCPACKGTGKVILADKKKRLCPECYGRQVVTNWINSEWYVGDELTVGQVRIEHTCAFNDGEDSGFSNYGHQEEKYKEGYMCRETGIDSGTVWYIDKLFASHEEARAECDRRNAKDKLGRAV